MAWFEDGTSRIYYEEAGSGDGVLLLQGFASSIEDFAALKEDLASAGYRVIAADLPGSGKSGPQPRRYSPDFYEEDALSFVALLAHLGIDAAHLIGFSDGGEVVLLIAALRPDIARSVVTWGAAGSLDDSDGQLSESMVNVVDNPAPQVEGFRDYLVSVYGKEIARATIQSWGDALNAIVGRGGEMALSIADQIVCPVLLIAGEGDHFAPKPLLAKLAAKIATVEVVQVEGVGHDVYGERPDWMTQRLLAWLKQAG